MTAAEQAMANIGKQVDAFMRGQSTPVAILMNITQIVTEYRTDKQ